MPNDNAGAKVSFFFDLPILQFVTTFASRNSLSFTKKEQKVKVVADSSSTRTEWALIDGNTVVERASTQGLNPYFLSRREISHSVRMELPQVFFKRRWEHVHFYGAGCSNDQKKKSVEASLVAQFKTPVTVESDMLGAARGLLVDKPGIACILGTGSNSCLYDGYKISKNVPPLGYVLGDEGSGASLGKLWLSDCLKGIAPQELRQLFYDKYEVSADKIMDLVYSTPHPNRTLSGYSWFLAENLDNQYVIQLIHNEISRFFSRNISQYEYRKYPVCFVGAVAVAYSQILKQVADEWGIILSKIIPGSLPGLIEFHSSTSDK